MDDMKVKIPKFLGTYDPKAYLDQEIKVDQIFNCNNFSEEKKMQLARIWRIYTGVVESNPSGERKIEKTQSGHLDGNEKNHAREICPTSPCKGNA